MGVLRTLCQTQLLIWFTVAFTCMSATVLDSKRHYTVVVVVKSKETGMVEYDTLVEANFGALTNQNRVDGLVRVTPEMKRLREQRGEQRQ